MAAPTTGKNGTIVVSALRARANFGDLCAASMTSEGLS